MPISSWGVLPFYSDMNVNTRCRRARWTVAEKKAETVFPLVRGVSGSGAGG